MKQIRRLLLGMLPLLSVSCFSVEDPKFDNPLDPRNGAGLPVPDSITVTVGNNLVRLDWSIPEDETVDDFVIYRKRLDLDPPSTLRQVKRVTTRSFQDHGVRNGQVYAYEIAAGRDGGVGERSEPVEARPGLSAVVIADDLPKTSLQTVSVLLESAGAQAVQLSESADSLVGPWRPMATNVSWKLSTGDGEKTLYAVFQYFDGSESLPVSDSIELDTQATIQSVDFDGEQIRYAGETIRFSLDADELAGVANVQVGGLFDLLQLFDDGSNGDRVKDDGVYERVVVVPAGKLVQDALVSGSFTDEVGNQATRMIGPRALSILKNPDAVDLLDPMVVDPPDRAAVMLRWTQSLDSDFAAYEIVRDTTTSVDLSDRLLATIINSKTVEYVDEDVIEGRNYFYRVFVRSQSGPGTGSNVAQVLVTNQRPPTAAQLQSPTAVGATRLSLQWNESPDLDFAFYRIHRNETGTVTERDTMVGEIHAGGTTFWDDTNLLDNKTYYYRVFTFDEGGLSSRSNEVSATTVNEAPETVTLSAQLPVENGEVTLSWTESNAHDFAYYRIYRNEQPNVSTTSSLRVEIADRGITSFRDTGLDATTEYYYRVFVVDEDESQGSKSSGSNTVSVQQASLDPVNLFVPAVVDPPEPAAVELRWTAATGSGFSSYRIFRDEAPDVDLMDRLIGTISTSTAVEFTDELVVEGTTYYYRVFVDSRSGNNSGSNIVEAVVPNLRSPGQVTLREPDGVSSTRISLNWSKAADLDFAAYRLYRNETGAVGDSDVLVAEITDADRTFLDDTGRMENSTYYYRVYTVDRGGLTSRSNEVSSTTVNLAPQSVTLQEATSIDSTAATLNWTSSSEHDFASYRLYRDVVATVTSASTLVVEIDEIGTTSFRDTTLNSSQQYFYRVYIVDDGSHPGPKSSGSNIITFTTL